MQKSKMFDFDFSYLLLPDKFYSINNTNILPKTEVILINEKLCNSLNLSINSNEDISTELLKNIIYKKSFSQAYAGHQFGHFTKLGDGRATILGEHITKNKQRFDIQLKGSGKTPYSRNGDGKATYKSMLREYLISEALYHLKIRSSRSLAVLKTGEKIYRRTLEEGSMLIRIMESHIRVGTFEYASYLCSENDLRALTSYTINRLYPKLHEYKNPTLELINKVMENQIDLVVNWMRVGFIHGVMNTDNTSITGESFDYGPCAFINTYKPDTSYSSIDHNKRYSFRNQPLVIKWNISRFAEALLPIIHSNKSKSLELAQAIIDNFDKLWREKYYGMMLKKIGIATNEENLYPLIDTLLNLMNQNNADYNNTFYSLSRDNWPKNKLTSNSEFEKWKKKWKKNINKFSNIKQAKYLMTKNNPVFIPRNHLVEKALEDADHGNLKTFQNILKIISKPYHYKEGLDAFMQPPKINFEKEYKTYCGT